MMHKYEPVDLIVAMGLCVTIASGYLLFLAAGGAIGTSTGTSPVGQTLSIPSAMEWLQPAVGQAVMGESLRDRVASKAIASAATGLNQALEIQEGVDISSSQFLDSIKNLDAAIAAEHLGHLQTVLGRSIVNFTARGVANGMLTSLATATDYTDRMLRVAEATRQRIEENFLANWQSNLGRAIVTGSHARAMLHEQNQERLGGAIVQLVSVQDGYEQAQGAIQEQLGSLIAATLRTRAQADGEASLISAESPAEVAEARSWPDISVSYLVAASVGLIGLFLAGLLLPSGRPEERVAEDVGLEQSERVYRKAV